MSRVRQTTVKGIFEQAAELAPEARAAFLDRACGPTGAARKDVERLLQAHDMAEGFLEPAKPAVVHTPPVVIQEKPGDVIGRYKLLQRIGEGGFGVVYMAEQTEPVRRRVALKIVKLGMDTKQVIARFEAERQALAMMDHPHIAKVFDAGATDTGRPYFVMELVKGIPITKYCDEARLPTNERLQLFASVCQALQHAHHKGIIHRDLKPSNVLVTLHDGVPVPKVIDFGIAKATEARLTEKTLFTEFRQIVGTPEYMSPEQAEMSGLDVDTRADIYSLGVLLYELLTGTKPLDLEQLLANGYGEMLKTIREVDPPRPSTRVSSMGGKARAVAHKRHTAADLLPKALAGDLDWIVMRALEKDRTRRYATAAALADDIGRHLDDRPVQARPPSFGYTVRKFVRRNRTGVIAGAIAAAAVLVGLVLAVLSGVEAANQRDVARVAEEEALQDRNAAREAAGQERAAKEREATARAEATREAERARQERDAKEAARRDLAAALVRSEGARLVATSNAWLPRDPTVALLLAIEGAHRDPGPLANSALLDALAETPASERVFEFGRTWGWAPMAIDPAGRRLAVGNADHEVLVFDTESGRLLHTLVGHENTITHIELSSDGRTLLTSSEDWTAGVWDADSGQLLHALRGHRGGVRAHGASNGRILTTSSDGTARIWDANTGEVVHDLGAMPMRYLSGRMLDKGNRALVWCPAEIRLYDTASGKLLGSRPAPAVGAWTGRAASNDGRWVVVTSQDGTLWLLDGRTAEVVDTTRFPSDEPVDGFAFAYLPDDAPLVAIKTGSHLRRWRVAVDGEDASLERIGGPDGLDFPYDLGGGHILQNLLVVPNLDGRVAAFHLPDFEPLWSLHAHDGGVRRCAFRQDGWLFTQGSDGTVRLRDTTRPRDARMLRGEPPAIERIDVSPDGRRVAAASAAGQTVSVWDATTGKRLHQVTGHRHEQSPALPRGSWATDVDFTRDGRRFLTCGMDGTARVHDTRSGQERLCLEPGAGIVWEGAFGPDGREILLGCQDEVARVYDGRTGELLHELGEAKASGPVTAIGRRMVGFAPGGDLFYASSMSESLVRVYSAVTGAQRAVFDGLIADFSPDGKTLAISLHADFSLGRKETSTAIVDVESMAVRHRLPGMCGGHPRPFTPDGTGMLTSRPGHAVLYDVRTGQPRLELELEEDVGDVGGLGIDPTGRFAAGVDLRGRLLVWDLETGQRLLQRDGCSYRAPPRFAPDGSWIATAKADGTVEIVPTDPLATAEREKPRDLTDAERERFRIPTMRGGG